MIKVDEIYKWNNTPEYVRVLEIKTEAVYGIKEDKYEYCEMIRYKRDY